MPIHARRLWMPEEDRVIDRYARFLAAGRYRNASEAAQACQKDIERLYARLLSKDPFHPVASRPRPFHSTRRHIKDRLRILGLTWKGQCLAPAETRVLERYVRDLVQGRYHDARSTAEACRPELVRLAPKVGRTQPLSLRQVQRRVYERAKSSGPVWSYRHWTLDEQRVVERYAREGSAGHYPDEKQAARACQDALRRLQCGAGAKRTAGRTFRAVYSRLGELSRTMGLHRYPRWRPYERKVVDRYMRALYEGRYRYIRPAAEECTRELGKLRQGSRSGIHTVGAVYRYMAHAVMQLGLPRYKGGITREEKRMYERYARAVATGRFGSCKEAARVCQEELRRLAMKAGRTGPLRVRRPAVRTWRGIANHIRAAVHRLGLRIPRQRWSEEEQKVFAGWLRWYERYRLVRRLQPLTQAGAGLSDDLAKLGYIRTPCACKERLVSTRRRMHGGG